MAATPDLAAGRLRASAAQTLALVILGGGSLAILAGIVAVRAFVPLSADAALLIFGVAQSLLSVVTVIAGFYFGASIGGGATGEGAPPARAAPETDHGLRAEGP